MLDLTLRMQILFGLCELNTVILMALCTIDIGAELNFLFNVEMWSAKLSRTFCQGLSINVNIFMSVQTIDFLRPPPPPPQKKSTHQQFLSAKNPHENNKNQAKKLKVYEKNVDFHSPPQKCMVCTLVKMLTFMDVPLVM